MNKITKERLVEILETCRVLPRKGMEEANPEEERQIKTVWAYLPGTYSFYDTVNWMIKEYGKGEMPF